MDASVRRFLLAGLVITALIAVVASQFASGDPDGLEYVAEQEGFAGSARDHDLAGSALADYGDGLTGNTVVDTALAGLVGVAVTLGLGWLVLRVARRRPAGTGT